VALQQQTGVVSCSKCIKGNQNKSKETLLIKIETSLTVHAQDTNVLY